MKTLKLLFITVFCLCAVASLHAQKHSVLKDLNGSLRFEAEIDEVNKNPRKDKREKMPKKADMLVELSKPKPRISMNYGTDSEELSASANIIPIIIRNDNTCKVAAVAKGSPPNRFNAVRYGNAIEAGKSKGIHPNGLNAAPYANTVKV